MYLALSPEAAPTVAARLCLRGGFDCFNQVARTLGAQIPEDLDPSMGISLTYDEFLKGIAHLRKVDFPIERDPADAWPDFLGWRVNYERAAYAVAYSVGAVPALWSGPRRHKMEPIPPFRPPAGRPDRARGRAARSPHPRKTAKADSRRQSHS